MQSNPQIHGHWRLCRPRHCWSLLLLVPDRSHRPLDDPLAADQVAVLQLPRALQVIFRCPIPELLSYRTLSCCRRYENLEFKVKGKLGNVYLLQVRGVWPAGLLQGPRLRRGGCGHNPQQPWRQAGDHQRVPFRDILSALIIINNVECRLKMC